jgi:hypothetical protein
MDRGLHVVANCASLGRVQSLLQASQLFASFANVCQDLQTALAQLNVKDVGCDPITVQQVAVTLEQLSRVQAPFPEESQRVLTLLRTLAEALRTERKVAGCLQGIGKRPGSVAAGPGSNTQLLHEAIAKALDGYASCVLSVLLVQGRHSCLPLSVWHVLIITPGYGVSGYYCIHRQVLTVFSLNGASILLGLQEYNWTAPIRSSHAAASAAERTV